MIAKEDQQAPTWRDSTIDQRATPESLSHYHSRQRAAAMAWLGSPPTEREPRAPLAEMMAATSSTSDFGLALGPNPVVLDEEPVASRNSVPFHRQRQPPSTDRSTPLHARTAQGRIPGLEYSGWQLEVVLPETSSTTRNSSTRRNPRFLPPGTRSVAQARSDHLDNMLEDVQQRRTSNGRRASTRDAPAGP